VPHVGMEVVVSIHEYRGAEIMQKIMNLMKKVCSGCCMRAVLAVMLFAVTARGDEAAHPVRWTEDIGIASMTEIEQRLTAPLALIGDEDDYLELTKGDKVVRISNGIDYIQRIKEGYYPMTRYDSAMERQASGQFMPLALIQKAKPSRVSYLADFALDRITLKDLPQDIMIFSERKPEGYTFHDDCPDAVIEEQTPDLLLWYCLDDPEDSYSKWGYRLKLLAWGDFNGDGIEDVLCDFMYDFVYGSNREAYMAVLTKYSAGDKIKLVSYGEQILRK